MAVAADWSELPKELLNLISERLDHELDLIRFRSICSHWRSSSISNQHSTILPFKFRIPKRRFNDKNTSSICYLSKRSIFLFKPPPSQQQDQTLVHRPWLIRVTQNSYNKKTKLYESSLFPFKSPYPFPFTLDLNKFSILHFGTDFIFDVNKGPLSYSYMYPKKFVVVTPLILATIHYNNRIVLLRHGDEYLTDIPCMSSQWSIRDICIFKGRMYIVEQSSIKTFTVGPEDLSVQLVAKYVHNGEYLDNQFLVESEGELLLVDVHKYFVVDIAFEEALPINVMINVFRLDEKEKEWVKLTSLGDRVLFLGDGCSFSASASDLYVAKENCVIFMDNVFRDNKLCGSGMFVFDLDQDRLLPLRDYPDYLNLFWPPPNWIVKGCMHKTKERVKQRKRSRDTRSG